jgi:DNA helicase II / ATP-dependent DNA helicase PcrA
VSSFIDALNTVQKSAVIETEGPSLVIAGAGSGKTRVLTFRIAYLLSKGVDPRSIMALTFTNKAAKEMRERISHLVGEKQARDLWMGTFHSIFSKLLRFEAQYTGGYTSAFTIYDTDDSKSLITSIIKEMELDSKEYKANDVLSRISMAKNNLITCAAYAANAETLETDRRNKKPRLFEIYQKYASRCQRANGMDFDDLLLNTNILFRDHLNVLDKYQRKFKYILVDEYQDTNFAQYLIIKKLSALHKNICVVGDDSQSIYSFRGAKIENILNFKSDYQEHKIFKLEQNYRSTKTIVDAANSLINHNKNKIPKTLWSDNQIGSKIRVFRSFLDYDEAYKIAADIKEAVSTREFDFSEIAILYRINAQSRVLEESLRKMNIPYRIYGGLSFYQRKEIKDVLAYFRTIVNHNDDEAIKRIINYPNRKVGDTTLEKISRLANENNTSIWNILIQIDSFGLRLQQKTAEGIRNFVKLISDFSGVANTLDVSTLATQMITRAGIFAELESEKTPEGIDRKANVNELLGGLQAFVTDFDDETSFPSIEKYLESVSLLTDADNDKDDTNKVKLMTVHSAKGLEFDKVFIAGVEEDLFPYYLSKNSDYELEEERRLFYVAITRAKKHLTISYTDRRFRAGEYNDVVSSRFIDEIDSKFLDLPEDIEFKSQAFNSFEDELKSYKQKENTTREYAPKKKTEYEIPRRLSKITEKKTIVSEKIDMDALQTGMIVEHDRFGRGQIITIEGTAPNLKALVRFENSGEKNLLLKFANLKIIR